MTANQTAEQPTIETAELGHTFSSDELREQCKAIVGGVSWPGKRPGFGVVLALGRQKHVEGSDLYLLDEVESPDLRVLIHRCAALDVKYGPGIWLGDPRHNAAERFIIERNDQNRGVKEDRRDFAVSLTLLLDMEQPYSFLLPTIKALLERDRRRLFLKASRITSYLSGIKPEEIPFLEFGEYPAVEALAFAVKEAQDIAESTFDYQRLEELRASRRLY